MKTKVIKVESDCLIFENGYKLYSNHKQDCCENHYLDFSQLTINDFLGLEFDLDEDSFFRRIEYYGIELIPLSGWSVRVPGYAENNGYYSSDLELIVFDTENETKYDITECQSW